MSVVAEVSRDLSVDSLGGRAEPLPIQEMVISDRPTLQLPTEKIPQLIGESMLLIGGLFLIRIRLQHEKSRRRSVL